MYVYTHDFKASNFLNLTPHFTYQPSTFMHNDASKSTEETHIDFHLTWKLGYKHHGLTSNVPSWAAIWIKVLHPIWMGVGFWEFKSFPQDITFKHHIHTLITELKSPDVSQRVGFPIHSLCNLKYTQLFLLSIVWSPLSLIVEPPCTIYYCLLNLHVHTHISPKKLKVQEHTLTYCLVLTCITTMISIQDYRVDGESSYSNYTTDADPFASILIWQ